MRSTRTRPCAVGLLPLVAAIAVLAPFLIGWHWAKAGWPSYVEIVLRTM